MGTVYLWHLKALGYCNRQMRIWCKRHEYSWLTLRKQGIDADYLLSLDDSSLAQNAVEFARQSGWAKTPAALESATKHKGCV